MEIEDRRSLGGMYRRSGRLPGVVLLWDEELRAQIGLLASSQTLLLRVLTRKRGVSYRGGRYAVGGELSTTKKKQPATRENRTRVYTLQQDPCWRTIEAKQLSSGELVW